MQSSLNDNLASHSLPSIQLSNEEKQGESETTPSTSFEQDTSMDVDQGWCIKQNKRKETQSKQSGKV